MGLFSLIGDALGTYGSFLGGALNAGANIISTGMTNKANKENVAATNATNMANWREQRAYDERLTREQWFRDDTAMQRTVADYQNAGLSPLAINGAMHTTPAISPEGPPNAIPFQAQQPNIEFNSMIDHFIKLEELKERKDDNIKKRNNEMADIFAKIDIANAQIAASIQNLEKQIKATADLQAERLETDERIASADRSSREDIASENRELENLKSLRSYSQAMASLQEVIRSNKEKEKVIASEYFLKEAKALTGFDNVRIKRYEDPEEYEAALNSWTIAFTALIDSLEDYPVNTSSSVSSSGGANAGASGMGLGANISQSQSSSDDRTYLYKAQFAKFFAQNPFPVPASIYY